MKHRCSKFILAVVSAQLAGCSWNDVSYPLNWLPTSREWRFGCSDLTGTYSFNGDYADSTGSSGSAKAPMWAFFDINTIAYKWSKEGKPYRFDKVTHVRVAGPKEGEIHVSMWQGDTLLTENVLRQSAGEFSCTLGAVSTKIGKIQLDLERSLDGALVTKATGIDCIPILFIPYCKRNASWFRWPRIDIPDAKAKLNDGANRDIISFLYSQPVRTEPNIAFGRHV